MTEKIEDTRDNYMEIIYNETPQEHASKFSQTLLDLEDTIKIYGAIPVFTTIPTMSLANYNTRLYNKGRSSYFLHSNHYDDMQHLLNSTIEIINQQIFTINELNGLATPNLAGTVISKRGDGQGLRFRYARLSDGLHPSHSLTANWKRLLLRIASQNRLTHES